MGAVAVEKAATLRHSSVCKSAVDFGDLLSGKEGVFRTGPAGDFSLDPPLEAIEDKSLTLSELTMETK